MGLAYQDPFLLENFQKNYGDFRNERLIINPKDVSFYHLIQILFCENLTCSSQNLQAKNKILGHVSCYNNILLMLSC